LISPKGKLYIADSGNHCIWVVDTVSEQLHGIWGRPGLSIVPEPSGETGFFNEPFDLAADSSGAIYVVESEGRRIQKLDIYGRPMPAFWEQLGDSLPADITLQAPMYIAVAGEDASERLFVVDAAADDTKVIIIDTAGNYCDHWMLPDDVDPLGIVVIEDAVVIGNAADGSLLQFDLTGALVGISPAYRGPVAALGLDANERLLLHTGVATGVVLLQPDGAFVPEGHFLAGPFDSGRAETDWHRLRVLAEPLAIEAHLQISTYTCEDADTPVLVSDADPFPPELGWRSLPQDAVDGLILNPPGRYLWLGGRLQGDGHASPMLRQIQVTWPPDTYLRYLPAIYQKDASKRPLIQQALSLFESQLGGLEAQITDMPLLFDPMSAPSGWAHWLPGWQSAVESTVGPPDWLPWLADWLAFDLNERWTEGETRKAIQQAFDLYGHRGTAKGLRRMLKLYAGIEALIEEPNCSNALWKLGETSTLGFDTMLAPAHVQGAVLDTTATLDRTHLIEGQASQAPLFEETAHLFYVWVYRADLKRPCTLAKVKEVLDKEKPAHTIYQLCEVDARFRVGFQARISVDAIVAGPQPGLMLDAGQTLDVDTVLAPGVESAGVMVGRRARLGENIVLA
jgi:phage tail-like protein